MSSKRFKILVCGSRTFNDYALLKSNLNALRDEIKRDDTTIISGKARGADTLAIKYANENNITVEEYPAQWGKWGKMAGYIRNAEMIKEADYVLAFWDGRSKGTKHTIELAKRKGIGLRVVLYWD